MQLFSLLELITTPDNIDSANPNNIKHANRNLNIRGNKETSYTGNTKPTQNQRYNWKTNDTKYQENNPETSSIDKACLEEEHITQDNEPIKNRNTN